MSDEEVAMMMDVDDDDDGGGGGNDDDMDTNYANMAEEDFVIVKAEEEDDPLTNSESDFDSNLEEKESSVSLECVKTEEEEMYPSEGSGDSDMQIATSEGDAVKSRRGRPPLSEHLRKWYRYVPSGRDRGRLKKVQIPLDESFPDTMATDVDADMPTPGERIFLHGQRVYSSHNTNEDPIPNQPESDIDNLNPNIDYNDGTSSLNYDDLSLLECLVLERAISEVSPSTTAAVQKPGSANNGVWNRIAATVNKIPQGRPWTADQLFQIWSRKLFMEHLASKPNTRKERSARKKTRNCYVTSDETSAYVPMALKGKLSIREAEVLHEEIVDCMDEFNSVNLYQQTRIWCNIARKVNAVNGNKYRTVRELRRFWRQDLKQTELRMTKSTYDHNIDLSAYSCSQGNSCGLAMEFPEPEHLELDNAESENVQTFNVLPSFLPSTAETSTFMSNSTYQCHSAQITTQPSSSTQTLWSVDSLDTPSTSIQTLDSGQVPFLTVKLEKDPLNSQTLLSVDSLNTQVAASTSIQTFDSGQMPSLTVKQEKDPLNNQSLWSTDSLDTQAWASNSIQTFDSGQVPLLTIKQEKSPLVIGQPYTAISTGMDMSRLSSELSPYSKDQQVTNGQVPLLTIKCETSPENFEQPHLGIGTDTGTNPPSLSGSVGRPIQQVMASSSFRPLHNGQMQHRQKKNGQMHSLTKDLWTQMVNAKPKRGMDTGTGTTPHTSLPQRLRQHHISSNVGIGAKPSTSLQQRLVQTHTGSSMGIETNTSPQTLSVVPPKDAFSELFVYMENNIIQLSFRVPIECMCLRLLDKTQFHPVEVDDDPANETVFTKDQYSVLTQLIQHKIDAIKRTGPVGVSLVLNATDWENLVKLINRTNPYNVQTVPNVKSKVNTIIKYLNYIITNRKKSLKKREPKKKRNKEGEKREPKKKRNKEGEKREPKKKRNKEGKKRRSRYSFEPGDIIKAKHKGKWVDGLIIMITEDGCLAKVRFKKQDQVLEEWFTISKHFITSKS